MQDLESINKKNFPLWGKFLIGFGVIGVLVAIALPSFFNQSNKARGAEARMYIGSAVRVQQKNYQDTGRFIPSWNELGLGIASSSDNYEYQVSLRGNDIAVVTATAKKERLNSFTGVTFRDSNGQICEAISSMKPPEILRITDVAIECPAGSTVLN